MNRRHFLLGLIAILLIVAFGGLVTLTLAGVVGGETYPVTMVFDRAGQLLSVGGDVKLRGVLVGRIESKMITRNNEAVIGAAMDASQRIPANVTATIRGKTLFGEKFIQLNDPSDGPEGRLAAGDEIGLERTRGAFELEQVLTRLVPVLDAVEPGDLAATLGALAEGFAGQEEAGRRAISNGLVALRGINSRSADFERLLAGLDENAEALARAAPDLVAALEDLDDFNRTIIANASDVEASLKNTPSWMELLAAIMESRFGDLVDMSVQGVDVLDLVVEHRLELVSTVRALKNFTQAWVTNMSVGCTDGVAGDDIGDVHPELEGSTCWQIWNLSAENPKSPGAYSEDTQPTPDAATAAIAYRVQLRTLLRVPFGEEVDELTGFLYAPLKDERGLLPEDLL